MPSMKNAIYIHYDEKIKPTIDTLQLSDKESPDKTARALVKLGYRLRQIRNDVTGQYSIAVVPDNTVENLSSDIPASNRT